MRRVLLFGVAVLLTCINFISRAQTTASYSFNAFSSPYVTMTGATPGVTTVPAILGDDLTQNSVPLGFFFNFCGTTYNQLSVCSNGWVSLANSGANTWVNTAANIGGAGWLMPYWDDLDANTGGNAFYVTTGAVGSRVFTFEWKNFPTYSATGTARFQIKLYETSNIIEFWYGTSTYAGMSATIGIANSTTDYRTLPNTGASPVPSTSPSGTFTNSLNSSPAANQVYQWVPCPVTVSASNTGPACPGSSVTLNGVTSGSSYSWSGPSGFTSGVLSPVIPSLSSTTAGTYTLVASNGTCTMSATTTVVLNSGPPPFTVTPSVSVVCGPPQMLTAPPILAGTATTTYTSTVPLFIPDVNPAGVIGNLLVSGIPGSATILDGAVALNNVTHTFDGDLSFGIQAPSGNNLNLIFQRGGAGDDFINTVISSLGGTGFGASAPPFTGTFTADASAAVGPTGFVSNVTTWAPLFTVPNGNWFLCVRDWVGIDVGTVNSWSVILHYSTPPGGYVWTPATGLYMDPGLTTPYIAGTQTNTVYASPSASTVYTVTGSMTGVSCIVTSTATVNVSAAVSPITGIASLCMGSTTTLTDASGGGTWASSNPAVGTISTTGVFTGITAGTSTVTYTVGLCFAVRTITVNTMPSPIAGSTTICYGPSGGTTTTLTDATPGGVWSSSNPSVGTVGSATGIVGAVGLGTMTITYSLGGCDRTFNMTVNPLPGAITGSFSLCLGTSTTLSSSSPGGIWVSVPTSVATVTAPPTSGIINGVGLGTSTISYTVAGCRITQVVTVVAAPGPIVGPTSVCINSSVTLTNAAPGGSWTSSNTAIGTIGSTTGVFTGLTAGTSTITYSLSASCVATMVVTVVAAPTPITGDSSVCVGLTTTLSHAVTGGTWLSSNPAVGTVGLGSGIVGGISAGTIMITYTLPSGCITTKNFTVNALPSAIGGTLQFCQGTTSTLINGTPGGTWSSSNTAVGTVGSTTGIVYGVGGGTSTITYALGGSGCIATTVVTVVALPAAIGGPSTVCVGSTITLTDATSGGAWLSPDPTVSVGGTGNVTGVSAGTANITYAVPTGCQVTRIITVTPTPAGITGSTGLCVGFTTSLSSVTTGGTWSSSNTAVGTINTTGMPGVVYGVSGGTTTISYTAGGCYTTVVVTVNSLPGAITGTLVKCAGDTSVLSNSAGGGIWTSSNIAVGTIGSASGTVAAISAGTTTIVYALGSGCTTSVVFTVNALPNAMTGTASICQGTTTTFPSTTPGGTWSSSTPAVGTVGVGTGIVGGISPGTSTISYTLATTGCRTTRVVTVNQLPASITGTMAMCVGATSTLSSGPAGGAWSSQVPAIGTVNATTGEVGGISGGTTTITYTLPGTGCYSTAVVLINSLPTSISGPGTVCENATISLTGFPTGGTWSSSTPTVATANIGTGAVTGISATAPPGTTTITYTLPSTCARTTVITVNPLPAVITGTTNVCVGSSTTLSSSPAPGTWTSSNPSIASIGPSSGIVFGIAAGTVTDTYRLATGCARTTVVTVNALPGNITGVFAICVNTTTTLSSSPAGGAWSSSNTGVGTVNASTGQVGGISGGVTIISYILPSGCYKIANVTVNALPSAISGTLNFSQGATSTLSSTPTGGTWNSSNAGIASVGLTTGIVSGNSGGTATITYTAPVTGCKITAIVTINPLPGPIAGNMNVCIGSTTALTNPTPSGTWASSNPAIGSVDVSSGVVTGIAQGTTTITYTLPTSTIMTAVVTVNPLPTTITGTLNVCVGTTTTLNSTPAGGTWISGNNAIATINAATGEVMGIAAGTVVDTYKLSTGCTVTAAVTVNPLPGTITGPTQVCEQSTIVLSSTPAGGAWSSASPNVIVTGTGGVTAVSGGAGTAVVTYTLGTGCTRTGVVTINAQPSVIAGSLDVCEGLTTTLSSTPTTGTWSSSNSAVAPVSSTGVVSGMPTGGVAQTATITYTLPVTGCTRTAVVTVNPLPSTITGSSGFCNLTQTTYSSTPGGGTWSSSNAAIIGIDPTTGLATGNSVGSATLTYTLGTGCITTKNVVIILAPYPIRGDSALCVGNSVTLTDTITGGTWTSNAPGIASINITTGVVLGNAVGTAVTTYVLSNGCYSTQTLTVNLTPGAITGGLAVCEGLTATVSSSPTGGSWSSSDPLVGTVDPVTGTVGGISGGTATLTYMMSTGCYVTAILTVNPLPAPLTGTFNVCVGSTTTLSSTSTGGTWTSGSPGIAAVDLGTGVVTGMADGIATITYSLSTGCILTQDVTVNPLPATISGFTSICQGDQTTLTDATPGGSWSSSDPSVASIDPLGVVTGVGPGTAVISYILPTGCYVTVTFGVNAIPAPIAGGALTVCAGFATNLTNSTTGGSWTSDPAASSVATINTITGVLTAITPGTVNVTYTLPTGCRISTVVTVIVLPPMISGSTQVCEQSTLPLSNPTPGGTWSSSNTSRATVDASGLVTGVSAGTATITYTVGSGCFNILRITVNPLPAVIAGPDAVCEGAQITLTDATPGGQWNSGATSVATVGITTGVVTGQHMGVATISYVLPVTGCFRSKVITVNQTPGPISGTGHICIGSLTLLTNSLPGGVWSSTVPSVATIGSLSGIVTPVSLGTTTISYTMPATGCFAAKTVTVQPLPIVYTVNGGGSYCAGGNGVHVGLNGSQIGVSYLLYHGSTVTGYLTGTGFPLDFGLLTPGGTYTVLATNAISGCTQNMAGSATIIVIPLAAPTVTIAPSPNDSVCPGTTVMLQPVTDSISGGTSPTYVWRVNGATVSTANSYSFIPANGDVVSVTMTSSAACISAPTGTGTLTMTVLPMEVPLAGITANPGDSVCQFTVTTFSAVPTYGGSAPSYTWMVDGVVSGGGPTFTYTPEDNDVVTVRMVSNYLCRLADTVTSGALTMSVDSLIVPHVTITPEPGLEVIEGHPVKLIATAEHAGAHPKYQWKVNGHPIAGATDDNYTSIYHDYDSITCVVTSDGVCNNISSFDWVFITVHGLSVHPVSGGAADIMLIPNPNKGAFTIKGNLSSPNDEEVSLEVTDMLGQVVYKATTNAKKGKLNEQVILDNTLANGMYMLTLRSADESKVFHFVMEQ